MTADRGGVPNRRRWVVIGTGTFLLAALIAVGLAFSGSWAAWSEMTDSVRSEWRIRPLWLALSVGCAAAGWLVSSVVWASLFRAAGGRLGLREAANAWLGSNLGRYLPGKIWQVTGLAGYAQARGGSGAVVLATLLSFHAVFLAVGGAIALAILGPAAFAGAGPWAFIAAALALGLALTPRVLAAAVRMGQRLLRDPAAAAEITPDRTALLRTVGGATLVWLLHGVGFWALLEGLVAERSIGLLQATAVFSASYVIGYLALIAPGGLIVREGAMASLLSATVAIPLGPAAALALAARLWATIGELAAFGLALTLELVNRRAARPR